MLDVFDAAGSVRREVVRVSLLDARQRRVFVAVVCDALVIDPLLWENEVGTFSFVEPVDFLLTEQENATQHKFLGRHIHSIVETLASPRNPRQRTVTTSGCSMA